jgi:hypothetical protein
MYELPEEFDINYLDYLPFKKFILEYLESIDFVNLETTVILIKYLRVLEYYEKYIINVGLETKLDQITLSNFIIANQFPYLNIYSIFGKSIPFSFIFIKVNLFGKSDEFCLNFNGGMYFSALGFYLMYRCNEYPKYSKMQKFKNLTETYIIHDTIRDFYKIGISQSFAHRERTLQSEIPALKTIFIINKNVEKELHKFFHAKRIRGEWFKLNSEDIQYIENNYIKNNEIKDKNMKQLQYYRNKTDIETNFKHENARQQTIDAESLWQLEGNDVLVLVNDDFYYHTELDNRYFYKTEIED